MSTLPVIVWPFLYGVFRLTPLLALPGVSLLGPLPTIVRLGIVISFSALIASTLSTEAMAIPDSPGAAMLALSGEFLLGLALAFSIHLVFGVLRFMGRLIDMQIGFAAAGIVDPTTQRIEALLGSGIAFAALVAMLAWNIHHDLIRGVAASVQLVPFGSASFLPTPAWLILLVGQQFLFGLMLFMPIVVGLLLLDVVIAYSSRVMPQVNVYFISLPLKVGVGLLLTAITLRLATEPLRRMFENALSSWLPLLDA